MQSDSDHTISLWMATADVPSYASLSGDAEADVCLIGAGIAGISTAYLLARVGKSAILQDDGAVGGGETRRATAHLSNERDDRYGEIEKVHGEGGARVTAESQRAERINCDLERVDGYLFLGQGDPDDTLPRDFEAAHRAGLPAVEPLDRVPLRRSDIGPCLRFPNQGQFHPLKYLGALATATGRGSGRIHTGSHAEAIEGEGPITVTTSDKAKVTAGKLAVCTNSPIDD